MSLIQSRRNARAPIDYPPPVIGTTPEQDAHLAAMNQRFGMLTDALRDGLHSEWFSFIVSNESWAVIQTAPVLLRMFHNPTAAAVTIALALDMGSPMPWVTFTLAAGAFQEVHLPMTRVAGYVSGGYVVISGELLPQGR